MTSKGGLIYTQGGPSPGGALDRGLLYMYVQWNLRNKITIWAMKSGLIFEVVLILRTISHVYMDLGQNQSGLISKVVIQRGSTVSFEGYWARNVR